jgi:hypothetical protein
LRGGGEGLLEPGWGTGTVVVWTGVELDELEPEPACVPDPPCEMDPLDPLPLGVLDPPDPLPDTDCVEVVTQLAGEAVDGP